MGKFRIFFFDSKSDEFIEVHSTRCENNNNNTNTLKNIVNVSVSIRLIWSQSQLERTGPLFIYYDYFHFQITDEWKDWRSLSLQLLLEKLKTHGATVSNVVKSILKNFNFFS